MVFSVDGRRSVAHLDHVNEIKTMSNTNNTTQTSFNYVYDCRTIEKIRLATKDEFDASKKAAKIDGGYGVIIVDGRRCFVS
jgi:hypothetical protein